MWEKKWLLLVLGCLVGVYLYIAIVFNSMRDYRVWPSISKAGQSSVHISSILTRINDSMVVRNGAVYSVGHYQDNETLHLKMSTSHLEWLYTSQNSSHTLYDRKQVEAQQIERLNRVKEVCKSISSPIYRQGGRGKVLRYKNIIMSVVPKAGCTNLLNTICLHMGERCAQARRRNGFRIHSHLPRISGPKPTQEELQNSNSSIFKFVVVRNPWMRLVSVFIQKFLQGTEYKTICRVKLYHEAFNRKKEAAGELWTFGDFLSTCVIEQYDRGGAISMNGHYRPQSIVASPCEIKYNFIGKLETYKTDELVVYDKLGITDVEGMRERTYELRRKNEKSSSTQKRYEEYWRSINQTTIEKLQQIYRVDIVMFDYPERPL